MSARQLAPTTHRWLLLLGFTVSVFGSGAIAAGLADLDGGLPPPRMEASAAAVQARWRRQAETVDHEAVGIGLPKDGEFVAPRQEIARAPAALADDRDEPSTADGCQMVSVSTLRIANFMASPKLAEPRPPAPAPCGPVMPYAGPR
jgi:hypothetical protein